MNRREFLTTAAATPVLAFVAPHLAMAAANWDRTLILVELNGGNDGLNMVVPYADPLYAKLRPTLKVAPQKVLQLDEKLGLAPEMTALMNHWKDKHLAVAMGVGYPDPNLSHFRGIEIWDTASDATQYAQLGWVAQAYQASGSPPATFTADGIVLGRAYMGPLTAPDRRIVVLEKSTAKMNQAGMIPQPNALADMGGPANAALARVLSVQQNFKTAAADIITHKIDTVDPKATFPAGDLGPQLEIAARLLVAKVQVPVIKVSLGGFDTHAGQPNDQPRLLGELSNALDAFAKSMKANGLWDKVLIMTYSEFGRRPAENGSSGTDHGTSAPHFLLGGRVKGGIYGEQPSLKDFADGQNMAHRLHFRSMYATAAKEWMGLSAPFLKEPGLGAIA